MTHRVDTEQATVTKATRSASRRSSKSSPLQEPRAPAAPARGAQREPQKTGSSSSAELLDCRPQLHGVRGTPSRRKNHWEAHFDLQRGCWERWFSRRFRQHWGTVEFTNHISTYKKGVGRDCSPKGFDSIGGTAEFTNHTSTYKEGVGRDGSAEGFDIIGGIAEFTNHISTNKEGVGRDGAANGLDSNGVLTSKLFLLHLLFPCQSIR